jgi:hypothetical protein
MRALVANIIVTNLTGDRLYLGEPYAYVDPFATTSFPRPLPRTEEMQNFIQLWTSGVIDLNVQIADWETEWRNFLATIDGGYAVAFATRTIHKPTVTPSDAQVQVGLGPVPVVYGSTMGLQYNDPSDAAFRVLKIDYSFTGDGTGTDASFHVHWTKASDADESGNVVRWRLSYTVFDGIGDDINVAPTVLDMDDTYIDAGTTTRTVYRTANVAAPGFIKGQYLGIKLEYVSGDTTLVSDPVVVSCDLLYTNTINLAG